MSVINFNKEKIKKMSDIDLSELIDQLTEDTGGDVAIILSNKSGVVSGSNMNKDRFSVVLLGLLMKIAKESGYDSLNNFLDDKVEAWKKSK